jgi:2-methylisocitrate lyase-like PEP mutase family enzyme
MKAMEFRRLDDRSRLPILPNSWDAPSARIFEDEDFTAVVILSARMIVAQIARTGRTQPILPLSRMPAQAAFGA